MLSQVRARPTPLTKYRVYHSWTEVANGPGVSLWRFLGTTADLYDKKIADATTDMLEARRGQDRPGEATRGPERPGEARKGQERPGEARRSQETPEKEERPGEARRGQERLGEARRAVIDCFRAEIGGFSRGTAKTEANADRRFSSRNRRI